MYNQFQSFILQKIALPLRYAQQVKRCFLLLSFALYAFTGFAQKQKADSLAALLKAEKKDTAKVKLMWQVADVISIYNPDTALQLAQQALFLAKNIHYKEGQSRSLGLIAEVFRKIGNYPRALEFNIKKLELEEQGSNPYNLASVLMNIGIVYVFQEEYAKGRQYYSRADSVITEYNIEPFKYNIALNLGDVYNRLNDSDSAFVHFYKSLQLAKKMNDGDYIGTSLTGLAHTYAKQGNHPLALSSYLTAIDYLKAANDDDIFCEAALGLAALHQQMGNKDSAIHYAKASLLTAEKDGFLSHELAAAEILTEFYRDAKHIDSAFSYMSYVKQLNNTINSRDKIRELQVMSSNEQLRQTEMEEQKRVALKERSQQLQLLFIGIFIPVFFLFTVLLSRVRIHAKLIRVLGILSLLFLFEYLTLWLHPTVVEITHHTPVLEILIFVAVAAILIPIHHRLEHWLIKKLTHKRGDQPDTKFKLKTVKLKLKTPPVQNPS